MQNVLVLLLVAVAVGYLIRRGWRYFAARKQAGSCGIACGGCASAEESRIVTKPLVSIDSLRSSQPQKM